MIQLFLFYFNSNKPGYTCRGGRVVSGSLTIFKDSHPLTQVWIPLEAVYLDKFNLNGCGYKPLIQVRGSCPHQVRPQSKESKDEDTHKKGKMTE